MAKYILKEMADGMVNKKRAPYPKLINQGLLDYEDVIREIRVHSPALSEALIRSVLDTLGETMRSVLTRGNNVKIDGLGLFSLSLGFSDAPEDTEKSRYRRVEAKDLNFKVDRKLLKHVNRNARFERAEPGVKRARKAKTTAEERLAMALAFIEEHGQMRLKDYVRLTGKSRSGASTELKRFTSDPGTGLSTRGSYSFKVWVKG